MISGLLLKNFQSHKKTILHFHPGVNAIIGKSNAGKTAILRSLYWIIYNRPSGISFVSFWNRDKKGNPIEPTLAQIINNNKKITRVKEKEAEKSGYIINEEILSAVGVSVPSEVSSLLNMGEVNIQKQMDAPFLLSESAEDVARFFNNIIRLDIIDTALSNAETERRSFNKDIKTISSSIESKEKEVNNYDWIEKASSYIEKYESIEIIINEKKESVSSISQIIQKMKKNIKIKNDMDEIYSIASKKIESLEKMKQSIYDLKKERNSISRIMDKLQQYPSELMNIDFSSIQIMVTEYGIIQNNISDFISTRNKITRLILSCISNEKTKIEKDKEYKKLLLLLPSSCPSCGNELKGEHICD